MSGSRRVAQSSLSRFLRRLGMFIVTSNLSAGIISPHTLGTETLTTVISNGTSIQNLKTWGQTERSPFFSYPMRILDLSASQKFPLRLLVPRKGGGPKKYSSDLRQDGLAFTTGSQKLGNVPSVPRFSKVFQVFQVFTGFQVFRFSKQISVNMRQV